MANYSNLKAAIADVIKTNGTKAITGQVLQDTLNSIVSVIGANYQFAGVATPATNPGTPDQNVFYIAMQGGTYTNFNATALPDGISLLMWNGSWSSQVISYNDGGVFDISVYKSTGGTLATFADLAAALGTNGANVPVAARKGGMSVKYVCSSDNKYVQYRLMSDSFNTTVSNWQGVDDEPIAGSENIVKSGGVVQYINNLFNIVLPEKQVGKFATAYGTPATKAISNISNSQLIDITEINTSLYKIKNFYVKAKRVSSSNNEILFFYKNNEYLSVITSDTQEFSGIVTIPDDADNVCINSLKDSEIVFFPVYYKEIDSIKNGLNKLSYGYLSPNIKTGFVTASGNPSYIVISNLTNSIYAEVNLKSIPYKKLYVTTRRLSSSNNEIIRFADENNILISSITSDVNDVVKREITVPSGAIRMYINGKTGYDIKLDYTVDVVDSLTSISDDVSKLNSKISYIDNIKSEIDPSITDGFSGISAIRLYSPIPYVTSTITGFGFNNSDNKFHIIINGMEGIKDYAARPTGGYAARKDTISFILDPPSNDRKFYYVEVDIDWIKYNQANAQYVDASSYPITINPIYLNQLDSIKGEIDLYSDEIIPLNTSLRGSNCHIKIHSVSSGFVVGDNVCLSNIVFTDATANAIIREEYTAEEIAEKEIRVYLFKPIISLSDLESESASIFAGDNDYGLIRLNSTATNPSIIGCTFNNFNRVVVTDSITRHKDTYHSVISGNMFNSCRTPMYCKSEFTRINNNYFFGCIFGIVVNCSNFNAVNCNFVRCDCGMYFTSNQNSHGEVSTFEFAHNGLAGIYAKTITNGCGFIFTNCQFAQAPIIAKIAYALKFSSCRMDSWVRIEAGAKNSIIGCNCGMNYVTSDSVSEIFDVPEDTLLALNRAYTSTDNDTNYNN